MDDVRLSAAGEARRQSMLRELQAAVRAGPVRRARRRGALVSAFAAAALAGGVWMSSRAPLGRPAARPSESFAAGAKGAAAIERVTTSSLALTAAIQRVRTDKEAIAAMRIGDAELLAALREAGHPAGLARIGGPGGRVIVTGLAMDDRAGAPGGG